MSDRTLWGIHAGKTGDADTLFLKKHFIAVGWAKMGDLAILPPDREAFKAKVAATYPDKKPGAIPNNAGQLFRFVHDMQPGDLVIYPSKRDPLDGEVGVVGFEIPFNRHFYVFQPPRPLEEIDRDLKACTDRIKQMIEELSA
jgi:restriction system protein